MLKIRLRRMGSRHRPFYRVVVSDSRQTPTARALEEIGYYDTVRFNADSEYIERIALNRPIVELLDVLVEYAVREGSLTETEESGMAEGSPGAKIRAQYEDNYRAWHRKTRRPYLSFPAIRRPFQAGGPHHSRPLLY